MISDNLFEFHEHKSFEGKHAFLGASKYHWINYTPEKLDQAYIRWFAAQKGTELHAFAKQAINLKIRMPKNSMTLNAYINDAILYDLKPEQVLYYSDNCFGTADAIGFKNNTLRVHDLKTGTSPVSMKQLYIYASIFCLEYNFDPHKIKTELRIYQNDDKTIEEGDPDFISLIMNTIVEYDKRIEQIKLGG